MISVPFKLGEKRKRQFIMSFTQCQYVQKQQSLLIKFIAFIKMWVINFQYS